MNGGQKTHLPSVTNMIATSTSGAVEGTFLFVIEKVFTYLPSVFHSLASHDNDHT